MFNRPPPNPLTPIPTLIAATVALYTRTFKPLFVTTVAIALALSTASAILLPQPDLDRPETFRAVLFASVILQAVSVGFLSVVLWRAALLHRGEPSSLRGAVGAVIAFGPRSFAGTMLLSMPLFVLLGSAGALAFPALGLTLFVWVRASLYVPAVVLENQSIVGAFVRSWTLVAGRWRRTFLLELIVAIPIFVLTLVMGALLAGVSLPVLVAVDTLATGIFIPFVSIFGLLLFEDYVRASAGTPRQELGGRPPDGGSPPR